MFQSKYAKAGTPTFVELTFLSHGKRYRVRRNPEYVRPKERGQGVTTQAARAELYFYDGRQPVTKTGEVTRAVEQILGFNYEQFTQIAMIAQGDFLRVLLASTEERKKIFRQLFGTERFGKLQECRSLLDSYAEVSGRKVLLEVDGGVKKSNIREIAAAGADTFVAGSAIFNEADYKAVIDDMRSELASL